MFRHVRLAKQDTALGIEAGSEKEGRGVIDAPAQALGFERHGDRMQVDDAVDRGIAALLTLHVLGDRPDVVTEVLVTGRLDSGEDPHGRAYPVIARATTTRWISLVPS